MSRVSLGSFAGSEKSGYCCLAFSLSRFEAGSSSSCGNPEEGATNVTHDVKRGFWRFVGGNGNGCGGNALTAQHEKGNGSGAWHVKVGCEQIEMVNLSLLELCHQGGEVGDGVAGAIVEVQLLGRNTGCLENLTGFFLGYTAGNPNL